MLRGVMLLPIPYVKGLTFFFGKVFKVLRPVIFIEHGRKMSGEVFNVLPAAL